MKLIKGFATLQSSEDVNFKATRFEFFPPFPFILSLAPAPLRFECV